MTKEEFKDFRIKHGLSQREMSEILGRERANISRYENGHMVLPLFTEAVLEKWERDNVTLSKGT